MSSAELNTQNAQVAAGQIGGAPPVPGQQLNASLIAQTRLISPDEFCEILLKVNADGSQVRLHDVARIERGGEDYQFVVKINGQPASALGIQLATGANALDTAAAVRTELEQLRPFFPDGLQVVYPYDTTPFIKISINEVVKTLFEAIVLVFLVMFLFLQNFRATLIPTIAVPVVLLGTFGILAACGFTINTLTMFGIVLAIGLLVDDAIVVVENVERVMREENLHPREATEKSMREITGALIGIAMVLSAVFLPMTFFSGSTGVIYRQFSITIVSSMVLSVIVALTLTPALCATLLKPHNQQSVDKGFFGWFNRKYSAIQGRYQNGVSHVVHGQIRFFILYGVILLGCAVMYMRLPSGFLPTEDQGYIMVQYTLPPGASDERTSQIRQQIEDYFDTQEKDNVDVKMLVNGFSFAGNGQNAGVGFIALKNWSLRKGQNNGADAIALRATKNLATIRDAQIFVLTPPSVSGLGQS